MSNLKTFFTNLNTKLASLISFITSNVGLVLSAIIGVLLFYLSSKNKEIAALKTQINLTTTQKSADILESEINQKLQQNNLLQKQIDGYNAALAQLQEKRKTLPEADKNDSSFWNNN